MKTDRTAGRKFEVLGNISVKQASELFSWIENFLSLILRKNDMKDDGLVQDILDTVVVEDYP